MRVAFEILLVGYINPLLFLLGGFVQLRFCLTDLPLFGIGGITEMRRADDC